MARCLHVRLAYRPPCDCCRCLGVGTRAFRRTNIMNLDELDALRHAMTALDRHGYTDAATVVRCVLILETEFREAEHE